MKLRNSTTLIATFSAIMAMSQQSNAQSQSISVIVNGNTVSFADTRPQSVSGRVLVPLRGVLEEIGADISWNEATQTVKAHMGQRDIQLQLGSRTALVNGETVTLRVPAMRIGGSTMVPLRFLGEALGASVDWDEPRQTVNISTGLVSAGDRTPQRDRGNVTPERSRREIVLRVDGREESFGTARPYLRGTEVMVPLERMSLFGKFNYRYDSDENMIHVRDKMIKSAVGSRLVEKDGQRIRMESPSEMRNGTLYVPLEFIEIASERSAKWNSNTHTIILATIQK